MGYFTESRGVVLYGWTKWGMWVGCGDSVLYGFTGLLAYWPAGCG